ncbi:MAG: PAS domain S-box protein [Byssovorax sp.]
MVDNLDSAEAKKQKLDRDVVSAVLENDGFLVIVLDREGRIRRFNRGCEKATGYAQEELLDKPFWDYLITKEELGPVKATFKLLQSGHFPSSHDNFWIAKDGHQRLIAWRNTALLDQAGEVEYVIGTGLDITELRAAEAERTELHARVIEAQRYALHEVSTPLLPIADGVVAMPLIGVIDEQRAEQMMSVLLDGVSKHRAETVILDITGVQDVDTHVADVFIRAAQAVRLLGAQVMLTGVKPGIATTLVRMDVDLHGIRTLGSLQAGIAAALKSGEPKNKTAKADRGA